MEACEEGNFCHVKTLLETASPNIRKHLIRERGPNGWTCFHWAAWHGDPRWIVFLLKMKELDIAVKNLDGITAFHVALKPKESKIILQRHATITYTLPSIPIIRMLLEVNNQFVNCFARYGQLYLYPLEYAIMFLHMDVVKLLIRFGGVVENKRRNIFHKAALSRRVDCMRYLIDEHHHDPTIRYDNGHTACLLFFQELLNNWNGPSKNEIEFFCELLTLTYKSPADAIEVCFMLIECFRMQHYPTKDNRVRILFMEIVKLLLPQHRRKHFVEKILQILPNDYGLTTLTLFENIVTQTNNFNVLIKSTSATTYLSCLNILKSNFLRRLFALFSADESFFSEYLAEVIKIGWTFNELTLIITFCSGFTNDMPKQKLFNFMKSLILHDFKHIILVRNLPTLAVAMHTENWLKVLVPLSNLIHVPIELVSILTTVRKNCHFSFNESESWLNDYKLLAKRESRPFEVVSLKNLSRMSVRKYVFHNFKYSEALSIIYTLSIPIELRQFLCYNYSNFKF